MSEKDNVNESGGTDDNSQPLNRRRFVKGIGVAGGAAIFGSLNAGNVAAEGSNGNLFHREQLEKGSAKATISAALRDNTLQTVASELNHDLKSGESTAYTVTGSSFDHDIKQVSVPVTGTNQNLTYATVGENTAAGIKIASNEVIQSLDLATYESQGVEHKRIASEAEVQNTLQTARQSGKIDENLNELQSNYDIRPADAEAAFIEERQEAVVVIPTREKSGYRNQSTDNRIVVARIDTTNGEVVEANSGFASCLINCGVASAVLFGPCYNVCLTLCGGTGGAGCVTCLGCLGLSGSFCALRCI